VEDTIQRFAILKAGFASDREELVCVLARMVTQIRHFNKEPLGDLLNVEIGEPEDDWCNVTFHFKTE